MPLLGTRGAASAQGFGEFAQQTAANYIEDVFSTYLYVGNGSTQTITNGIDLSTKGGLVWVKRRNGADSNFLFNSTTAQPYYWLRSDETIAQQTADTNTLTARNANGFSLGSYSAVNGSSNTFASWTFRKQPKFFDVVTYTATGSVQTINHNLGSTPGCIIVKNTSANGSWFVWHTSLGNINGLRLQTTGAATDISGGGTPFIYNVSSTSFTVATGLGLTDSGNSYVVYLFAHNAGGFGAAGTDNVISCGSATCSGGVATINLGWEPQWILAKQTNTTGDWRMIDNMRGWTNNSGGNQTGLQANTSAAEATYGWGDTLSPTGCNLYGGASDTFIYIAIRRGPMKTPTSGSTVYGNNISGTSSPAFAFPVDVVVNSNRGGSSYMNWWADRLRGSGRLLVSSETTAESAASFIAFNQGGYQNTFGNGWGVPSYINWGMRRAPGFMDVVCYTGTGVAGQTFAHNLGVVPELMIVKKRSSADQWNVYHSLFGGTKYLQLNSTAAVVTQDNIWNNTNPTASVFSVGVSGSVNTSGGTYVAYLFASCPGVSKVGSYSGTGATQTISCGFAVRFVLIKRTDSTGDWWVWDTTRGMVAGTDPRLALNLTSAETNANWVYTNASGFQIVTTDASVNASGGSYIYLAIA